MFARTFYSLRHRNFRLFFLGQLVSNTGNWLTNVALTLLVLNRTGSGSAVGLMIACEYGPLLLFSAWAGLVADRSNKRHLLYLTQTLEMAESFLLAALSFVHSTPLPVFYVVAGAGGCLLSFDNPGRRSFVGEMVPEGDLPNAVTLYSAMNSLSRVMGPAIAGALIVALGYGWAFTVDGTSYVAVIAALVMMRASELYRSPAASRGRGQVRAGIRYIVAVPELWATFVMLLIIGVVSYNFQVVFPLFVEKGLGGDNADFTLVYTAFSGGGFVGTMLVARRHSVTLLTVLTGAGIFGIAMLGMFFVPDISVAYGAAAVVGGASVAYMTATTALAQLRADRQMVGRVLAIQTVFMMGTTPIGGPILGWVADTAGGRAPVLIGAVGALVATAIGGFAGRKSLRRDRLAPDQEVGGPPSDLPVPITPP